MAHSFGMLLAISFCHLQSASTLEEHKSRKTTEDFKFPPAEVIDALQSSTFNVNLMAMMPKYKEYVESGRLLRPSNYCQVLTLLLQVEDVDTIHEFKALTETNVTLRSSGDEYSLMVRSLSPLSVQMPTRTTFHLV